MAEKSLVEFAYDVLSGTKDSIKFRDLFEKVAALAGVDMSKPEVKAMMSRLYTQLSLDGRFVTLTDNTWDLRSRHLFSEVHIDMEDAYSDDDETEVDLEEKALDDAERGESSGSSDEDSDYDFEEDEEKSKESEEL